MSNAMKIFDNPLRLKNKSEVRRSHAVHTHSGSTEFQIDFHVLGRIPKIFQRMDAIIQRYFNDMKGITEWLSLPQTAL